MNRYLLASFAGCAALAGVAAVDPFNLRHGPAYTAVLVLGALVLGVVIAARTLRDRMIRIVAVSVGGLLIAGWLGLIGLTVAFAGPEPESVTRSGGESGRIELVLVRGYAFADPVYSVRLRAGSGPFAQESVVWQGLADAAPPGALRFVGDDVAEVVAAGGCGYRSTFDRITLDVDPVNRPVRLDGC